MPKKTIPTLALSLLTISIFLGAWTELHINRDLASDLTLYLRAGDLAVRGLNPYQLVDTGLAFIYPPVALLLFTPLSQFPEAEPLWLSVGLVSLGLTEAILLYATRARWNNLHVVGLTFGILLFAPSLEELTVGQVNNLVLLGVAAFLLGMVDDRFSWVGDFGLAVAISLKISPIILAAVPVAAMDVKRSLRIVGFIGLFVVASVLFFGFGQWMEFAHVLPWIFHDAPTPFNEALLPTLGRLVGPLLVHVDPPATGRLLGVLLITLWLVSLLALRVRHIAPGALLSLGVATMTISSPLVWFHHLVFLLLPVLYLTLTLDTSHKTDQVMAVLLLAGIVAINASRLVETRIGVPLGAIAGYFAIYVASGVGLFSPTFRHGSGNCLEPGPKKGFGKLSSLPG